MIGIKKIFGKAKGQGGGNHRMPRTQPEGYGWKLEFNDLKEDPRGGRALEGPTPLAGSRPTGMPVGMPVVNASKHHDRFEENATATQVLPKIQVNHLVVSDIGRAPSEDVMISRAAFNLIRGSVVRNKESIDSIIAGFEEYLRREAEAAEEARRMVPETWLPGVTFA